MQYACVLRGACVLANTWQEGLVASHCQRAKRALAGVQGFCFSFFLSFLLFSIPMWDVIRTGWTGGDP